MFSLVYNVLEQVFDFALRQYYSSTKGLIMKKGDNRLTEIFNYLRDYIDNNGYPPTVREIADEFNIKSTSTVHYYLEKLKNSGMIDNVAANKKRAISMTSTRTPANYVKLVGNVSAGTGILAVENVEGEFPLPKDIFGGDQLFMLRVEGESMINAGIDDGDMVVVHQQNDANIGEIVLVYWEEKATIKRLVSTRPNLVLHPENDAMDDIVIPPSDTPSILGKVVGCIKKF